MLLNKAVSRAVNKAVFQWAPTLGGECYWEAEVFIKREDYRFNGHPPLGVNATHCAIPGENHDDSAVSMGTHPWG